MFVGGLIDISIVDSSFEFSLFGAKNFIAMVFINNTIFRLSLKSTKNRKHVGTIDFFVITLGPPFSVCIINMYISFNIRAGTMGKSIVNITTVDLVILNFYKCKT